MHQTTERFHWLSLIQFVMSLLGALFLWLIGLILGVFGLNIIFERTNTWQDITSLFLVAAGLLLCGTLLLPSAGFALARMLGKRISFPSWLERLWRPTLLIFFLPFIIFLGDQISRFPRVAWLGLPLLHVLAVGLPVLWLTYLGRQGLYGGTPQRSWGIFASGLVLGPGIILFLEMVAVALVGFLAVLYLASFPEIYDQLTSLAEYMNQYGAIPEDSLDILFPYLTQPVIIYTIFAFIAGIVPIIEESLKPIGVWIFAGRIQTTSQGFVAGLLSGAGFALFENLMLSTLGEAWAPAVILRIATGLLHIITAGLMGWALALAWQQGRFLRLGLAFLTVIFIHSLWNALAILSAVADLGLEGIPNIEQIPPYAAGGLAGITVLMFIVLLASNRSIKKSTIGANSPLA